MHDIHTLPRRVFDDGCDECNRRAATIEGLAYLDDTNLTKLANLAAEVKAQNPDRPKDASYADLRAVHNLRLAARLVFKSGISEEVAR